MNVLILDGNENQAVAAVRSLRRAGHDVYVGAESRWSKAGWSRSATGTFEYPSPGEDAARFVAGIVHACEARHGALVLPMTERTMLPLSEHRERLRAVGGSLVLPAHDQVTRACSKHEMTTLAASLGLAVPDTWTVGEDEQSVRALAARVSYPVVLKPAMSHESAGRRMRATGAPLYANDAQELLKQWRSLVTRSRRVVVQSFLEGTGAGYFALVHHGRVCVEFAHRRIRDVRPTGSGSAVRESVAVEPQVALPARRLLEALGWHGVAMVEYRVTRDGVPVFLEVNPRFWNSLPLAIAAGVDFPRMLVDMALTDRLPSQPSYHVGVRGRWWLGDVQHLVQVMRGAPRGYPGAFPGRTETVSAFLSPHRGTVSDNFRWDDPWPEIGDWLHFLGRRVPAWLARVRRTETDVQHAEGRTAHP